MKISIVTISFNQVDFIEKTILSIISQGYKNLEYIVVDAGSTDGSRDIINKYNNDIQKVIFEPDKGQADGLNKGFKNATGDIFAFVNSDDLLLPKTLRKVAHYFNEDPSLDVIYGNGYKIDQNGNIFKSVISDQFSLKRYAYGTFNFIQPSMFFRRTSFEDAGGFNLSNTTCWDGELIVDFAMKNKKIKHVDDFFSQFRIHKQSISGSGKTQTKYFQDRERIFKKIMGRDKNISDKAVVYCLLIEKIITNPKKYFRKILFSAG